MQSTELPLQVFFGRLTESSANFYAKLPPGAVASDQQLTGFVSGPHCEESRTLPAANQFRFLGVDPTPLALAMAPDPTFWSPELPARYEIKLQLRSSDRVIAEATRWIGLRRLGAQGRSFVDQGRRMVVRGATPSESLATTVDKEQWRELRLHQVVRAGQHTDLSGLTWADRVGLPLVVMLSTQKPARLGQQLECLAQSAATTLAVVESDVWSEPELEAAIISASKQQPNLRMAAETLASAPRAQPSWASAMVLRVDDNLATAGLAAQSYACPLVLLRPERTTLPLADLRRGCESLQRDFTPYGDFAGYLV